LTIRKAKLTDVPNIHRLVNHYADERIMLPRTLTDLYENVWEFTSWPKKTAGWWVAEP